MEFWCHERDQKKRAISFYQREGFIIQCEGLDEATGEKEYTMLWKQKQKSEYGAALHEAKTASVEVLFMKCHVGMDRLEIIGEDEP